MMGAKQTLGARLALIIWGIKSKKIIYNSNNIWNFMVFHLMSSLNTY
jgi:hypothetical protein